MEKEKVTIYDVARRLGVSTTTVNRVLNNKPNVSEKTRKAVMDAAVMEVQKSGGFPVLVDENFPIIPFLLHGKQVGNVIFLCIQLIKIADFHKITPLF